MKEVPKNTTLLRTSRWSTGVPRNEENVEEVAVVAQAYYALGQIADDGS